MRSLQDGAFFRNAGMLAVLLCAPQAGAAIEELTAQEARDPVLVFAVDDLRAASLPERLQLRDFGPVTASRLFHACQGLASAPGRLLAFDPSNGRCRPFSSLGAEDRRRVQGRIAARAGDDAGQVPAPVLFLLRPRLKGSPIGCGCPPDVILDTGFEPE